MALYALSTNSGTLTLAQAVAKFSQPSETKKAASYTFLGIYGPMTTWCMTVATSFKTHFTPDMVVTLGHLSYRNNIDTGESGAPMTCMILPPNNYYIPENVRNALTYGHTFYEACQLAECLQNNQSLQFPIAVSFTLKGRLYKPKTDDPTVPTIGNYDLLKECALGPYGQDAEVLEICNQTSVNYKSNFGFNEDLQAVTSFDKSTVGGHALTFDNSTTLRRKLCDAKFNLTSVKFTVAVYDINYDSGPSTCPTSVLIGEYGRTKLIHKLVNFLKNDYTDSGKHGDCLKVT